MTDYFIADSHLGHTNIIKYCNRPFRDSNEMDEIIIGNWNSLVSEADTVYHLGDFALAKVERILDLRNSLYGHIVLVMGNHDRRKTATFWSKLGFEAYNKPIERFGYILSHEPVRYPHLTNIHGHTHQHVYRGNVGEHGIHICVSCEVTNYSPVSLEWIKQVEGGIKNGR